VSTGRCTNVYIHARGVAERDGLDIDAVLRDWLGDWYPRRIAFDSCYGGAEFIYGALNVGGLGPTQYGYYCFVIAKTVPSATMRVAYLPGDSLKCYVSTTGVVDHPTIAAVVANHAHRGHLAVCKHAANLESDDWNDLVCNPDDYIEAIFETSPTPADVDTIRIAAAEYDRLYDLTLALFSASATPEQLFEASVFQSLISAADLAGIPVTVI